MQGDARVVQLPDDHGHVFPTAGRCQQQLMHLERHAHILAVRIVEQPARKGTQALDIRFGQGGRVAVVDKLRQQCLILPHQALHLSALVWISSSTAAGALPSGKLEHCPQHSNPKPLHGRWFWNHP